MRRVIGWFAPVLPDSRLAAMRTVVFLFVMIDINAFVRDPIPLSRQPELYQPLFLERLFHLPPPSVPLTVSLYVILMVGSVIGAANRLPRLVGFVVAAAFTWWTAIGMSFGKVDHDHLALVVALWVLPTAGAIPGRWRATTASATSGWALKCIQIAVIMTYFLSALTKIRSGGWSFTSWPESAILLWAIVRRPHGLGQFLLPYPELLRPMQWLAYLAELTSVVVLWLRGRALLYAGLFWLSFHIFTVTILYIHFLPTLVCWLAFTPLERLFRGSKGVAPLAGWSERLGPWTRGVVAGRRQRAGRGATGHPGPVARDDAVDRRS